MWFEPKGGQTRLSNEQKTILGKQNKVEVVLYYNMPKSMLSRIQLKIIFYSPKISRSIPDPSNSWNAKKTPEISPNYRGKWVGFYVSQAWPFTTIADNKTELETYDIKYYGFI